MRTAPLASSVALLALVSGCGEPAAPASTPPPSIHVANGFVRDLEGRALLLRGMNLAGAHKQKPYFSFHTLPDYRRVRDAWGMNALRFLVSWAAIEPEEGVYDEAHLSELTKRLDWAREAKLLVVLDMHQDVYGEGFASGGGNGAPRWTCDAANYASFVPNPSQWFLNYLSAEVTACYDHFWQTKSIQEHYAKAWAHLATALEGYDDVVIGFDPMNEPYWGSYSIVNFEADLLKPFYEEVIGAVRRARPGWIAFAEPASSRNLGIPTGLLRFTADNIVYAPHSYDRDAESGKGFDPSRREAILQNLTELGAEAKQLGAGLWIGEYGGVASDPGIAEYMDAQYAGIGAVAGGSSYWAYDKGGGYAVLAEDGSEKAELLAALVRPWPERVAGDPLDYAFDPASRVFTLRYRPDASLRAPTVIAVPDRVYPEGYEVDCGGCEVERAEGSLLLHGAPAGDPAQLTLSPIEGP
jgi:endoglycosylceramidase